MYAESPKGEISKRELQADDVDGVHALYLSSDASQAAGCSTSGTSSPAALLMALVAIASVLRRARRVGQALERHGRSAT